MYGWNACVDRWMYGMHGCMDEIYASIYPCIQIPSRHNTDYIHPSIHAHSIHPSIHTAGGDFDTEKSQKEKFRGGKFCVFPSKSIFCVLKFQEIHHLILQGWNRVMSTYSMPCYAGKQGHCSILTTKILSLSFINAGIVGLIEHTLST